MKNRQTADSAVALFRQLAAATRRGLPLQEVGQILSAERPFIVSADTAPVELAPALARGEPLSSAMQKTDPAYAAATVHWVLLAEQHGALASALDALADDWVLQHRARTATRLTLLWPASVALAICALLVMTSIFVMPAFAELYADMGADLPVLTRTLFVSTSLVGHYWWLWAPLLAALGIAYLTGRLPTAWIAGARSLVDRVGFVNRLHTTRMVSRLLGICYAHHAERPVLSAALGYLAATTSPPALARTASRLQAGIDAGQSLSETFSGEAELPRQLSLYARLGERMGDSSVPLAQLRESAEQERQAALVYFERTAFLMLYLLLGLGVGTTVLGIYLPIFKLGAII